LVVDGPALTQRRTDQDVPELLHAEAVFKLVGDHGSRCVAERVLTK
jgi:hypothetical protein